MRLPELGKFLILTGSILLGLGLLLYFLPNWSKFPWLQKIGRLPGDIAVEREGLRIYFPLGTSLLLSLLLSLVLYLIQRWRN
ncbi:MAG: DUF2905 domain-containing protein [bacterium]